MLDLMEHILFAYSDASILLAVVRKLGKKPAVAITLNRDLVCIY